MSDGEDGAIDQLERRYRRLLAWYPWEHRRVYEDEMLGVLLAGARPGQRHPAFRESVNLAACAVRMRLNRIAASVVDPRWIHTAAAVGLLAAISMLTLRIRPVLNTAVLSQLDTSVQPAYGLVELGRLAVWATVVLAALIGARQLAALAAWAAVLADVGVLAVRYPVDPVPVVYAMWALVLAVVAAAALSVSAPPRHGLSVLGWRRLALIALACALALAGSAYDTTWWFTPQTGPYGTFNFLRRQVMAEAAYAYALAGALILLAVLTLTPPVRRRVVALLAPVPVTLAVLHLGYSGWADSAPRFITPVLLVPAQWIAFVATPVLTLFVGVAYVRWQEQLLRLVELGRGADRASTLNEGR